MFEDFLEQFNKDKNSNPESIENINQIYKQTYEKLRDILVSRLPDNVKNDQNISAHHSFI